MSDKKSKAGVFKKDSTNITNMLETKAKGKWQKRNGLSKETEGLETVERKYVISVIKNPVDRFNSRIKRIEERIREF